MDRFSRVLVRRTGATTVRAAGARWRASVGALAVIAVVIAAMPRAGAAEAAVSIEIGESGIRPAVIVGQVGVPIAFVSTIPGDDPPTLSIRQAGHTVARRSLPRARSWRRVFERPGRYELRVEERPALRALIVIFEAHSADSSLRSEKVSYGLGYDLGEKLHRDIGNLDVELFHAGLEDAYAGREPGLERGELDFVVNDFQRALARHARERHERLAARNRELARQFLARHAEQPGVQPLPGGLQRRILQPGTGERPDDGSTIRVRYRITRMDGSVLDDEHATKPTEFAIGPDLLPGLAAGLKQMRAGARWELGIPPSLAFGAQGRHSDDPRVPPVEPETALIVEVELLDVVENGEAHGRPEDSASGDEVVGDSSARAR